MAVIDQPSTSPLANMNVGEVMHEPKDIQQPQHHGDGYHGIQDRLYGACHGDEAIHQPQENSDNDQNQDNLK
jgi:hypothetical protein